MNLAPLQAALKQRLDIVADHALRDTDSEAHLALLKKASFTLDEIVRSLPSDCDPMLRHYLERQSYAKALTWLEEQEG